jgi:succinate-semialdehyde dehydrogenase/glutarate-semialdehyde dehydrogenase
MSYSPQRGIAAMTNGFAHPKAQLFDRAVPTGLFIGGRWLPSGDGSTIPVIDPASGDEIATVADGTVDDVLAAVDAAASALSSWAATAPRVRGEILRRAFELMIAREEWFAQLIVAENGKAYPDALSEVRYAAEFFRWYAGRPCG